MKGLRASRTSRLRCGISGSRLIKSQSLKEWRHLPESSDALIIMATLYGNLGILLSSWSGWGDSAVLQRRSCDIKDLSRYLDYPGYIATHYIKLISLNAASLTPTLLKPPASPGARCGPPPATSR